MALTIKDLKQDVYGKDIYIIGGGTSFKPDYHIPLLPKSQVVCLNSALKDFDSCLAVLWLDRPWMNKNMDLINEKRQKYGIYVNKKEKRLEYTEDREYFSLYHASAKDFKAKKEPYEVCGNNAGSCAIHLFDQLEAKTIYLLGFDCREEEGKSHYHDRYGKNVTQKSYNRSFLPNFKQLSRYIENSRVVNLSENTMIKSFKTGRIESILKV